MSLHGGVMLYSVGGSPNNLSAFCFRKGGALKNAQNERALVLHLIQEQGKGKSLEELKASAKQRVVVPSNLVELEDQLKIFGAVCSIIFDKRNPISTGIKRLLREFDNFSCKFESLMESDDQFAAKIMFSVDSRIQRFLIQCKRCSDREDVNDNLLNFSNLSEEYLNQSFNISLPPAFHISGAEKQDIREKEIKKKRKTEHEKEKARYIVNDNTDDTFKLKDGETWNKTIVGTLTKDTPFWDKGKTSPTDCKMCRRWHIRGHCFSDCPNAASHVPKVSIPSDRKEAMKGYLAKVRKS